MTPPYRRHRQDRAGEDAAASLVLTGGARRLTGGDHGDCVTFSRGTVANIVGADRVAVHGGNWRRAVASPVRRPAPGQYATQGIFQRDLFASQGAKAARMRARFSDGEHHAASKVPDLPPLLGEANIHDPHPAIHRLHHVVDREGGDGDGGQGFHLDARLAGEFAGRGDIDRRYAASTDQFDPDRGEGEGWQSGISPVSAWRP